MHCEGKYAKQFRDWAEDVLYEVMITGTYLGNEHSEKPNTQPLCSSLKLPKIKLSYSEVDIPKSYRGWNLNKRGTNKKGQTLFNLVKKIDGTRLQKYIGVWNQEKADKLIDKLELKSAN